MNETFDYISKVVLIGESGVGKTCLLQYFTEQEFTMNHLPTIAIDFKKRVLDIKGTKLKMQIWDTAGQERFTTLSTSFFKGTIIRLTWHTCCFLCG